jgi:alpha-acetolactate decarboxylase
VDCTDEFAQRKADDAVTAAGQWEGTVHDLRVELPTSAEFLKTNFDDRALNEKIKAAEG